MHIAVDIIAGLILLFFLLAGWHKGFVLSVLGVFRVVVSYGAAYASGRYLGLWLGEVIHRPRFVTIPICTIMAFILVAFVFHVVMTEIRARHEEKEKKENFRRPLLSCLFGSVINLSAGVLTLILLFWLGEIFMVGTTGHSIPGSRKSQFGQLTHDAVFESVYFFASKKHNAQQASALAHITSYPADGFKHLEAVMAADSVRQIVTDPQLAKDCLSGNPETIQQNASMQQFFNDRATLDELREMGLLSGYEKERDICEKLAKFGQNEKIQTSIKSLQTKNLLSTDKITTLIRDPDFDTIIAELVK